MAKYLAKDGKARLLVSEQELTNGDVRDLIVKLNNAGFSLGSGHESVSLKKAEFYNPVEDTPYVLYLIPYTGHVGQWVFFYPNKRKPKVK